MNTTKIKGSWQKPEGKFKQIFAVLTDEDLMLEEGKEDEFYGKDKFYSDENKSRIVDRP